jgi:hypothetical protein
VTSVTFFKLSKGNIVNLNLSNSGGGNGNYIRFSPQANAWSNQDGEFILEKFVFDYENLETGWMHIAVGIFEFIPDATLGQKGAQPSADHKRGFKATFYNKTMGVAEFSANGAGANMGINALWKQIQAQSPVDHAGKLPVVQYTGSRPEKVGKGSTRVPEFNVTGWVARPAALSDDNSGGFDPEVSVPVPVKPAPSPIKAKPAPTPAMDDDEMFS